MISTKKWMAAFLLLVGSISQTFANEEQIIWVKAQAYPTGAGTVYTDWASDSEKTYNETSEFKRHTNGAIGTGFVWAKPADGYQLAGFARDNGNGTFDNDTQADKQIYVRYDGYFDAVYDPKTYSGSSSSEAYALAEEAMNNMTAPTDLVYAVFSQGAVARPAVGQEPFARIWASKLYTTAGDQVTFTAYGDSFSDDNGVVYYKFDHWTNDAGETVGTNRELTVTVLGHDVYYANFVQTTKDDFKANEKDPHSSSGQGGEEPWSNAIDDVQNSATTDNAIYDLQGRKMSNGRTKGLFIQNGKKIWK